MYHSPELHEKHLLLNNDSLRKSKLHSQVSIVVVLIILAAIPLSSYSENDLIVLKYLSAFVILLLVYILAKIIKKNRYNVYFTANSIELQYYYGQSVFYKYEELNIFEFMEVGDPPQFRFSFTKKKGRPHILKCDPYRDLNTLVALIKFLKSKNKNFVIKIKPPGGDVQSKIIRALLHEKYEY